MSSECLHLFNEPSWRTGQDLEEATVLQSNLYMYTISFLCQAYIKLNLHTSKLTEAGDPLYLVAYTEFNSITRRLSVLHFLSACDTLYCASQGEEGQSKQEPGNSHFIPCSTEILRVICHFFSQKQLTALLSTWAKLLLANHLSDYTVSIATLVGNDNAKDSNAKSSQPNLILALSNYINYKLFCWTNKVDSKPNNTVCVFHAFPKQQQDGVLLWDPTHL